MGIRFIWNFHVLRMQWPAQRSGSSLELCEVTSVCVDFTEITVQPVRQSWLQVPAVQVFGCIRRSVGMDAWNATQLKKMQNGGNDKMNSFLQKYGISKTTDIPVKYNSPAAEVPPAVKLNAVGSL